MAQQQTSQSGRGPSNKELARLYYPSSAERDAAEQRRANACEAALESFDKKLADHRSGKTQGQFIDVMTLDTSVHGAPRLLPRIPFVRRIEKAMIGLNITGVTYKDAKGVEDMHSNAYKKLWADLIGKGVTPILLPIRGGTETYYKLVVKLP